MTEITMPRLSDSMEEGTILSWLKATGDSVTRGEELVEIETDKATMTYESPAEGVLSILGDVGSTYPVGAVIATVGDRVPDQPTIADDDPPAADPVVETEAPAPPRGPDLSGEAIKATPLARRIAREHGVVLAEVRGSGPNGRILRADVAARAGIAAPPAPTSPLVQGNGRRIEATPPPPPAADPSVAGAKGEPQIEEPTRLQRVVARRMAEAKAMIPHFQVQTDADMGAALDLRQVFKAQLPDGDVPSVNDLIVKAAALALREHPRANGAYRDGRFELYPRINVGIAVAADDALVVPTITDADMRSLGSIAKESRRLARRVRDGAITPPELSGATFTISNLGMYGMTAIVPVINGGQAAILGVGATRAVPALRDGVLGERHLMTLTLSCDHRILYGADAARFLSRIRDLLEQPLLMAL